MFLGPFLSSSFLLISDDKIFVSKCGFCLFYIMHYIRKKSLCCLFLNLFLLEKRLIGNEYKYISCYLILAFQGCCNKIPSGLSNRSLVSCGSGIWKSQSGFWQMLLLLRPDPWLEVWPIHAVFSLCEYHCHPRCCKDSSCTVSTTHVASYCTLLPLLKDTLGIQSHLGLKLQNRNFRVAFLSI